MQRNRLKYCDHKKGGREIKSACAINDGIKAALALRLGVEELKPLRMQFERGPCGFEKQAVTAPQATLPRALGLLG